MTDPKQPKPTDERSGLENQNEQVGAAIPKKEISKGDSSVEAQEKRAKDKNQAGLTASEMARKVELENKPNLTPEEKKELTQLGYKNDHGVPMQQDKALKGVE